MSPHPTLTGTFEASPWSGRDTALHGLPPEAHLGRRVTGVRPALSPAILRWMEDLLASEDAEGAPP